MTFTFLLFTITIKKRTYSGEELERLVRQQKLEEHYDQQKHKFWM
ncbi:YrzI family small protein [Halalkalibacter krulwichiae]|uniref:Putative sporulation protein (Bac_small_yrzI) n=1 Tax=Halalkalibacter krulwichiae TaxID=199441 RepID=A0A1X9M6Z3_9BACI|nr:YrzI family small protein [Halalkalibacter krulwichiae]ARK29189.1 putative sporulation protein (Bac_small_yrzI) [Halalkalibacter krulwichiae]